MNYKRITRSCRGVIALAVVLGSCGLSLGQAPSGRTPATSVDKIRQAYTASGNASTMADYDKIVEILAEVLQDKQITPRDAGYVKSLKGWAHNRRGEGLVSLGKEEDALIEFDLAVDMNGRHWKALHNRGVSLAHIGRVDEAIADFGRALALKQDYANSWFNRGELLYEKGEYKQAVSDYDKAIELDSEDPGFYNSRGHAQYQLRAYDLAIRDYNKSIQYDPENSAARVNRGDVLFELGRYEEAAKDYMSAIEIDPNLGRAYQSAAWMMAVCPTERFRDATRAVTAAEKAIELDGRDDYRYVETLAAALANAERFEEAVAQQTEVVKQAPPADKKRVQGLLDLFKQDKPYRVTAKTVETAQRPK